MATQTAAPTAPIPASVPRPRSARRRALQLLRRSPTGTLGAILVLLVILAAALAPLLAPSRPDAADITIIAQTPALFGGPAGHLLGTDGLGRDVLSRVLYGSRVSLLVGLTAVIVQGTIGIALGLTAGFRRGWIENVIMRVADIEMGLPFLVLAIAVMAVLGAGLQNLILVLGVTGWVVYTRIVRGEVLSLREREFVQAARVLGARDARIVVRHVLPNVVPSIIVVATLQIPRMIIAEASLSYLGLGVPPSVATWGAMIADGNDYVSTAWWISAMPGVALVLTALGINLLGDWLREVLDPRQRTEP